METVWVTYFLCVKTVMFVQNIVTCCSTCQIFHGFTAELVALNLSLDIIRRSKRKKFAIFSDSLSSLLAIYNRHLETGYVQKFITDYSQLSNSGKTIIIIWIPSHTGSRGNELVDEAAKSALNLSMSAVKCPATDLYSDVANHCQRLWQAE